MSERLDHILKKSLTSDYEPDLLLNQKIINQVKEQELMKMKTPKWIPRIIVSLVIILVAGSGVVYAAYKFLTAEEAVESIGNKKLALAFSGEEGIEINETQKFQAFDVTLLGIASGENLSEYVTEKNGEILEDRSYIVTAVARTDGETMPENLADSVYDNVRFFISPLISGCDPAEINLVSLDGVYSEFVRDGVLYRLTECSNIEIFADRTVYLCVSDVDQNSVTGYNEEAYTFDANTGEIRRSDDYDGVNALFVLPLDKELADPEASEELLSDFEMDETEEQKYEDGQKEAYEFMSGITPDNIEQYAVLIEDSIYVFDADEDEVSYKYTMPDGEQLIRLMIRQREFPDGEPGMSERISYFPSEEGVQGLKMIVFTLNEDGTVTGVVYIPK